MEIFTIPGVNPIVPPNMDQIWNDFIAKFAAPQADKIDFMQFKTCM